MSKLCTGDKVYLICLLVSDQTHTLTHTHTHTHTHTGYSIYLSGHTSHTHSWKESKKHRRQHMPHRTTQLCPPKLPCSLTHTHTHTHTQQIARAHVCTPV